MDKSGMKMKMMRIESETGKDYIIYTIVDALQTVTSVIRQRSNGDETEDSFIHEVCIHLTS